MFMSVALRNGCYGSTYSLVTKMMKNVDFTKRLEAVTKELYILKMSVPIRSIPFKCIFVRLEKALII